MDPVETYISQLHFNHSTGAATDETSYYAPLANLLNEIGKTLKPKVTCVINPRNRGAGLPDGGFFTPDQVRGSDFDSVFSQIPSRGAMEVKGADEDVVRVADREQVRRYLDEYGLVLVTNYRDFLLMARGQGGTHVALERYTLAGTAEEFWREAAHPRRTAQRHSERLVEYLKRIMLHAAPLVEPKDVAWFLASYARDARARVEAAADLDALSSIRGALEEALGVKFEGEKGEHFFRSTLVQTLFYGLFSAWVLWSKQRRDRPGERFDWRMAQWSLHVPMIRALFEQISTPSRLGPLGLDEVMEWAGEALNRVVAEEFFAWFQEEHAVQYFYEPFLAAFDPELRKELGVWYTPPEIVQYMVARVDTVLREELDIRDGLADPNVYVLDPCCGTGAYLVEVLKRISKTLKEKSDDALVPNDVKRAAMDRVFGFEILPAPFVVAHLQLGLLLTNLGAPLSDERSERAGVYLTNALTGWEPPREPQRRLAFPEMEEEREAAEGVKREKPILVILGNPPYNAFAGVSPAEEQGLVEPYKEGLISEWGIKKFNLDDLYVRFFRLAERRIAEMTGRGVVCYISNQSWISDPSFVVLRQHLLGSFDRFWIENMHGNRKISEYAPDGKTSETIFAIPGFSPGIQQGVAISLWAKVGRGKADAAVLFRDDIDAARAVERRAQLLSTLSVVDFDLHYERAIPSAANRFSFRPQAVDASYMEWPRLTEICGSPPGNGLMEKRGGALIDIDRSALERRMRMYYDADVDWDELKALRTGLTEDAAGFAAKTVRPKVQESETFDPTRILRYALRPLDTCWCYYSSVSPLWNRCRPALWGQCWEGNAFVLSRVNAAKHPEGSPFYYAGGLSDDHLLAPDAACFALRLRRAQADSGTRQNGGNHILVDLEEVTTANLSTQACLYLATLGITTPDADAETAGLIWMHALAIGYSPAYLSENADGIRRDWPRIPLPDSKDALLASAELGRRIADLLDTEKDVAGVTTDGIPPQIRAVAAISAVPGHRLNPQEDLAVTVGWGHAGKDGVTMPGKGKLAERRYTAKERTDLPDTGVRQLGETTFDVYLNDKALWKNVPARVWDYHIGGYQVIKKWLSYRERNLLGRPITPEEAREVTNMARRIAAILFLEPELDANYRAIKDSCYPWPDA